MTIAIPPRARIALSGVAVAALLPGCALQPPSAWERDILAKPSMAITIDPLQDAFTQHIQFSKEASSGGYGVGGGGCGCN